MKRGNDSEMGRGLISRGHEPCIPLRPISLQTRARASYIRRLRTCARPSGVRGSRGAGTGWSEVSAKNTLKWVTEGLWESFGRTETARLSLDYPTYLSNLDY
jgi:hypothetical protein